MKSNSKRWPTVRSGLLALFCLLSFAFTVFGLGMDGMRHSRPGPTRFDPYYLESWAPCFLAALLLLTLFMRFSRAVGTIAFVIFLIAPVGWFLFEAHWGEAQFGAFTGVIAGGAVFLWWSILNSRYERNA